MKEENKVVEDLEEKQDDIAEEQAERVDEVKEIVEDTDAVPVEEEKAEEEKAESTEEVQQEDEEAEKSAEDETVNEVSSLTPSKHEEAKRMVMEARTMVQEAEEQLSECKLLLASDLKEYEEAKQSLKDHGMQACEILLEKSGYVPEKGSDEEPEVVAFQPQEEIAPIVIKDVSGGGFTGFIMALIAGFLTLAGMVFAATQKAGLTLDLSKVPTQESLNPVMQWYASLVGMPDNPQVGGGLIVLAVLIVMWIVYKIRVSTKASSNLRMATKQLAAAQEYTVHKSSCKDEMDKVDAYIHDVIKTLKTYEVIFNEQKGKLERILFIEADKVGDDLNAFHEKSLLEMRDTRELIDTIKDFTSVPMSEEGKLSGKSSLFLHRAKSRIQKMIERLY